MSNRSACTTLGVVLGAVYVLPYIERKGWFYICSGLWLVPTAVFLLNPLLELFHPGTGY